MPNGTDEASEHTWWSFVLTDNQYVPALSVHVKLACHCASRGCPQLRFDRLEMRCWAARSPPVQEQDKETSDVNNCTVYTVCNISHEQSTEKQKND